MSELTNITLPIQMYDPSRDYNLHKEELNQAILSVVEKGNFINGTEVKELERELEKFTESKHAITCGNGTDALFVALKALNIGQNDEVITVALTWISSAETISMTGAMPVWVDVKRNTFCMDENLIEEKITEKTKAILVVSLYGYLPDYEKIYEIATRHNLFVIEDGAQSFGAMNNGYKSCSNKFTHVATTSFFPTKPLGCFGDGGCMFTNNDALAIKLRAIKSHGGTERFKHKYIGVNSRLDTIQASILLTKLKYFDETIVRRNACAQYYNNGLCDFQDHITLPMNDIDVHVWAQYSILFSTKEIRDEILQELKKNNINCSIFYPIPLYRQECFSNTNISILPVTEYVCNCILNLPCYSDINDDEKKYILQIVKKYCSFST